MLRVGLTGGIGAGKTTVARIFGALGIPVFFADEAARSLMDSDPVVGAALRSLFGEEIFTAAGLDRPAIAKAVFGNNEKLLALNALVHPATYAAGDSWFAAQQAPYAIKEAAIFFETGGEKGVDVMIGVSAPDPLRIHRAMDRSDISEEAVRARMAQQMPQDEKMGRCRFVIVNDDQEALLPQVLAIHRELLAMADGAVAGP